MYLYKVYFPQQSRIYCMVFILCMFCAGFISSIHSHYVMEHMFLCCLARGHTWKLCINKSISDLKCVLFTYLLIPTTPLQYWLNQEDAAACSKAFQRSKEEETPLWSLQVQSTQYLRWSGIHVSCPFIFFYSWRVDYFCWFTSLHEGLLFPSGLLCKYREHTSETTNTTCSVQ